MAITLGVSFGSLTAQHGSANAPPILFLAFGLFMLGFVALWFVKLLLAIIYGIKAGSGQWAEHPILARLARKILNKGSGGAMVTS
jgi:hypothetical protein